MEYKRLAIALALAASVAVTGCAPKAQQQRGPVALNVDVAKAQVQTIATYITLDGQVAPLESSSIAFQQSGPITTVFANEGDRVAAGQVLARIDASTLQAELAQDEALITESQARARSSQINVPITQSQTSSAVSTAKAALDNAQLTYNQNQQLYKQGYVSESQLESSRAAYVQAQAQYRSSLSGQQNTAISSANAAADRAALQSAIAQANTLRTQISQTTLYAPFDGVITARLIDPGSMASPGAPVYQISKIDTVYINVNVPDEDLAYVRPGTPVSFRSQSLSKTYDGVISTVNSIPTQGTLSYRARITESNPGDLLRGGMLVSVTVQKARHPNAIVVPRAAIAQTDQGSSVFIVTEGSGETPAVGAAGAASPGGARRHRGAGASSGGGTAGPGAAGAGAPGGAPAGPVMKAEQVPVQIGLQTDTLTEVISPRVHVGTVVITTRPDALQNGSAVAVNATIPGAY